MYLYTRIYQSSLHHIPTTKTLKQKEVGLIIRTTELSGVRTFI